MSNLPRREKRVSFEDCIQDQKECIKTQEDLLRIEKARELDKIVDFKKNRIKKEMESIREEIESINKTIENTNRNGLDRGLGEWYRRCLEEWHGRLGELQEELEKLRVLKQEILQTILKCEKKLLRLRESSGRTVTSF